MRTARPPAGGVGVDDVRVAHARHQASLLLIFAQEPVEPGVVDGVLVPVAVVVVAGLRDAVGVASFPLGVVDAGGVDDAFAPAIAAEGAEQHLLLNRELVGVGG